MITAERLREVLHYDPETGVFTCRINRRRARTGDIAGTLTKKGYVQIAIDGSLYLGHRLAWLYMTGEWPELDCDHEDTNKSNNRWSNLREATPTQNNANCRTRSHNVSGLKGVRYDKRRSRWWACLTANKKFVWLGYHPTPEAAHAAYVTAAKDYFGEFARAA